MAKAKKMELDASALEGDVDAGEVTRAEEGTGETPVAPESRMEEAAALPTPDSPLPTPAAEAAKAEEPRELAPLERLQLVQAELDAIGQPDAKRLALGAARGRAVEARQAAIEAADKEIGDIEFQIDQAREEEIVLERKKSLLEKEKRALEALIGG